MTLVMDQSLVFVTVTKKYQKLMLILYQRLLMMTIIHHHLLKLIVISMTKMNLELINII